MPPFGRTMAEGRLRSRRNCRGLNEAPPGAGGGICAREWWLTQPFLLPVPKRGRSWKIDLCDAFYALRCRARAGGRCYQTISVYCVLVVPPLDTSAAVPQDPRRHANTQSRPRRIGAEPPPTTSVTASSSRRRRHKSMGSTPGEWSLVVGRKRPYRPDYRR